MTGHTVEPAIMRHLFATLIAVIGSCFSPEQAAAAPKASDLVRAELIAEPRGVLPGQPFTVAIRLTMADHWHTYWRNPGDSGLATEIAWTLPASFSAGPIDWPTPTRIPVSHLVNYGYENEVTLLVAITPPASLPSGRPVELKAQVSYLVCERECIPGDATLTTSLAVSSDANGAQADGSTRYIFDAARASLPQPSPWSVRTERTRETIKLRLNTPDHSLAAVQSAYFFPYDETAIEHAASQTLSADDSGMSLTLQVSALAPSQGPDLAGVLVVGDGSDASTPRRAFAIGSPPPVPAGSQGTVLPSVQPAPVLPVDVSLEAVWSAAFLAFLGGVILNLMPCVFPVLSIKVISLVRHSGQSRASIRLAGLAYAAGVVASFVLLAVVLLVARSGGADVGWGFQLQSPIVVAALAFLLFATGLSLSGAVEFGTGVAALAGRVPGGAGHLGSFATGVLAAAIAAPCTAPFMGAAVGYALTAPAAIAFTVFVALALGMAAPFVLLTFWPGLVACMPRPGAWMETLKQVLAFPVYATVAWLLFVLSQQVGPSGLFAAMLGLVLIAFALWCWTLAARHEGGSRFAWRAAAVASLVATGVAVWTVHGDPVAPQAGERLAGTTGPERFTEARLEGLLAEGRPVFVNMTAAWCITCLVNERAVLSTDAVKAKFDEAKVVYLKGDWTTQNPDITRILARYGRSGVPLYVLYPGRGEPVVLPQILTSATVLESLGRIPAGTKRADLRRPTTQE